MPDISRYLKEKAAQIDKVLDRCLPAETEPPQILHQAMRYSVFAGGKRIRPTLCMAVNEALGGTEDTALIPAAAIECLHTYSLIHDDLPAMDDDELRRGKPTCHIQFGEAQAILAGDALLTLAFELLATATPPSPYKGTDYVRELARAGGSKGMIGGQTEDMLAEESGGSEDRLYYIHRHKTAALIQCAVRIGAISAGASPQDLDALSCYGEAIGMLFQVVDDILNATGDADKMGKAVGTDKARGKLTSVSLLGLEESKHRASESLDQAEKALGLITRDTALLAEIAEFIAVRAH